MPTGTSGLLDRFGRSRGDGYLEAHDVDVHRGGFDGHRIAVLDERAHAHTAERGANGGQRLADAVARALVRHIAPEQRGQLAAWLDLARPQGRIGEQRERLAAGQRNRGAVVEPDLHAAEQ